MSSAFPCGTKLRLNAGETWLVVKRHGSGFWCIQQLDKNTTGPLRHLSQYEIEQGRSFYAEWKQRPVVQGVHNGSSPAVKGKPHDV